jgi:hypothetical protein
MKKFHYALLTIVCTSTLLGAFAGTQENFNSRNNAPLSKIKAFLQDQCWIFKNFEINRDGWVPNIDGDGAMVSGVVAASENISGMFTPLLAVNGKLQVNFNYKFNKALQTGSQRWLSISLTDVNGKVIRELDRVEFDNINNRTVYTYNKTLAGHLSGNYKLFITYQGKNGNTRIAIDNLSVSAAPVFENGCKEAPVANNYIILGSSDRHVSGNLFDNELMTGKKSLVFYSVTSSPDGEVTINKDGSFSFIPNNSFTGSFTNFSYKVCDIEESPLCSEDANVTLKFPEGIAGVTEEILPQSLYDFKGFYQEGGNVEIKWATNFEQNSDRFEVERSLDGSKWITAGTMKGQGISANRQTYAFIDKVGRNTAHKNDLYYRLKQVNLDKKESFSKILVVRVFNKKSLRMVSVTPNPVVNDISVNVQLNEDAYVVMKIVNNEGNEMMRKSQRVEEGQNSFVMDGSNKLTPGMYFLEVTVNSKDRMIAKLLKQ